MTSSPDAAAGHRNPSSAISYQFLPAASSAAENQSHFPSAVRRSRTGLAEPNRPTGSFLFMGPTGVGKTELARAVAEFLFDDEHAMIRIDMSEYMEPHSVAKLIGAPPGYIGYEEGGQLTEAVRRRPYSVVLFDEIEKAHPDVFNALLQVLDEGRMTDSQGRTVNFASTVVIMTSNVGSRWIQELGQTDPDGMREKVTAELRAHFRPEFLNRIDDIIFFGALSPEQLERIVDIQVNRFAERLSDRKIRLVVDEAARRLLAREGYDPVYGARPLQRVIQKRLMNPLATELLGGRFGPEDTVKVTVKNDDILFEEGGA